MSLHTIVARYLTADEEEDPAKGGVPPRWQEWLDSVHQGGKAKGPNPNPETKSRYPEIAFSTALKDKNVFKKAMEDYHRWVAKNPEKASAPKAPEAEKEEPVSKVPEKKPEAKKEEEKHEKTPPKAHSAGPKLDEKKVNALVEKHRAKFDAISSDMKNDLKAFEKTAKKGEGKWFHQQWKKLSEPEKMIVAGGHRIADFFEKNVVSDLAMHEEYMGGWAASTGGEEAQKLCGVLAGMGVKGDRSPTDKDDAESQRKSGVKDKKLKGYVDELYNFTQAYFKYAGLKTIKGFRGVKGQGVSEDPPKEGSEVALKTREASSFSMNPRVAAGFGRPIEYDIPVEMILASPASNSPFKTEAEIVLMGSSGVTGKIINSVPKGFRLAASKPKPIEIHLNQSNEDWLASGHKKDKPMRDKKAALTRIITRFTASNLYKCTCDHDAYNHGRYGCIEKGCNCKAVRGKIDQRH